MENNDEKLTYSAAISELEKIVREMQSDSCSIDNLSAGTNHPLSEIAEILQIKVVDNRRGAEKNPCRTRSVIHLSSYAKHREYKENMRGKVYQNAIISCVETWRCRVLMSTIIHKTLKINSLPNQIVETQNFASLLPH